MMGSKEIRKLLEEALNDDQLLDLCQDEFPKVANLFTTGQTKSQRIRLFVDYVDRQREIPKLLAAIAEINSNAYHDFITRYPDYLASPKPPIDLKCDVLVLAANPQGTELLELEREGNLIRERLQEGQQGQNYVVKIEPGRVEDLSKYLLQYQPRIVHFSGHGSCTGEILFADRDNQIQPIAPADFAKIFEIIGNQVECVVLNSCFSLEMADELSQYVLCTIGMNEEIDDRSAVTFTGEFYRGLAFGRGYYQAFELGRNQIQLRQLPDADAPRFITRDIARSGSKTKIEKNITRGETSRLTATLYPVWYGTNRQLVDSSNISKGFSGDRDDRIHYGCCQVSVPKSHRIGSTGSPWWKRLQTLTDDRLKLELSSLKLLDEVNFFASIETALAEQPPTDRAALVFIHGFNVSFEAAAIQAAQIGFDLQVPGIMAFYSWPSMGKLAGYPADEATIDPSGKYIKEFLLNLAQNNDIDKVHIIAHSMGNRGLLRAMELILNDVRDTSGIPFGQIFLAAPDVDPETFKDVSTAYQKLAERTTLYVSDRDKALAASGIIHNRDRVGFFPPIKIFEGIDTVEVSNIDLTWLGHGYISDAREVLTDMHQLLMNNQPPDRRAGLRSILDTERRRYWQIGK
jgi:esterase/lipase superfamily enzyme